MKERTRRVGFDPDWPWFKHLSGNERLELRAGIYRLIHAETGMYYIGSTIDIHRRITKHLSQLRNGEKLPKSMIECFQQSSRFDLQFVEHERIEDLGALKQLLFAEETKLLQQTKNDPLCLNVLKNAEQPRLGLRSSEETKKKLSASLKGRKLSPEQRAAAAERMRFYATDPECIRKRVEKRRGWRHTPEAREEMSRSRKGRKLSEEHKKKLSAIHKGRVVPDEWKQKISDGRRGSRLSPEAREKLQVKWNSPEYKEKMRQNNKNRVRPVVIHGVLYSSTKEARDTLRVNEMKLREKLNDPNNLDYQYVKKD